MNSKGMVELIVSVLSDLISQFVPPSASSEQQKQMI